MREKASNCGLRDEDEMGRDDRRDNNDTKTKRETPILFSRIHLAQLYENYNYNVPSDYDITQKKCLCVSP
jgi:hypothetical protein